MPELSEPLPSEQLRRKKLAEEEAEWGIIWTTRLNDPAARKIYRAYLRSTNRPFLVEERVATIRSEHGAWGWEPGGIEETLNGSPNVSEDDKLDVVAAISFALDQLAAEREGRTYQLDATYYAYEMYDGAKFRDAADDILLNHRVEWAFTPGGLVSRGNQELHAEIVKPATELLAADAKYLKVKNAYNKALLELSNGDPGDAITDASSALQEMFRTLGVEGKSASEQAKKALNQGLLKGYDAKLIDTVVRASEWVSAERNNNGDAHKDGSSSLKEDAWLIIHIAGALILRLSGQALRSPQNDQRPAGGGEPVQEGDSF